MAILNGHARDPSQYNRAWLAQNVMASTSDLDTCLKFHDNLVFMDAHRWIPGTGSCKDEVDDLDAHILSLSLGRSHRAPWKLEHPHRMEADDNKAITYSAFVEKVKKLRAEMGDEDPQLTHANKRFLETYFGTTIAAPPVCPPTENCRKEASRAACRAGAAQATQRA